MNCRFARLLEFAADHQYFAGTELSFLDWAPTPQSAAALAGNRCLYRSRPNGGLVLYEVDTNLPGSVPLVSLADDLVLTFVATEAHPAFTTATAPMPRPALPFHFSNRRGVLASDVGIPHAGALAGPGDQLRLTPPRSTFRVRQTTTSQTWRIRNVRSEVMVERTVPAGTGEWETAVDLTPWAPGRFEIWLGEVLQESVYVDPSGSGERPVAVLELELRPAGGVGFSVLGSDRAPRAGGCQVRVHFGARATYWRYVVVPKTDPEVDPGDVRIEHTPESGAPFEFAAAGTQAMTAGQGEALLLESKAPIALRAVPCRGLKLQTRATPGGDFVSVLTDLPNPRPGAASPISTVDHPVSEVFVYL